MIEAGEPWRTRRRIAWGVALRLAVASGAVVMLWCARQPALWPAMVAGAAVQLVGVVLLWRQDSVSMGEVVAGAVVLRLAAFGLPPVLSEDVFRYAWDGLLQLEGINPFSARPVELAAFGEQHAQLFERLNSPQYYTVYPPVSQLLFAAGAAAVSLGWSVVGTVKGLLMAAELGGLLLLARMVPARGLLLYAWQPLVVLEVAGQAHTESLAVGLLVLAFWAERRDHPFVLGAALAAATAVKLYPILLVPLLVGRRAWGAVASFTVATALVWLPYIEADTLLHLGTSLQLYVRQFEFNAGLYYLIKEPIEAFTGFNPSWQVGPLLQITAVCILLALYVLALRLRWSLAKAWIWGFGTVLVCATTVHPWYVVPLFAALPMVEGRGWQWHVWSLGGLGTYLFYSHDLYWPFVLAGWGGWAAVGLWVRGDAVLQHLQRLRAFRKARWLSAGVPGSAEQVLDVGAAEGYVGEELARQYKASVTLVDVIDMNRTARPLVVYDGRTLPFHSHSYDVVLLSFVLHHCEEPELVLREALRVTRRRLLVLESVYTTEWQRRLLEGLDRLANRLRSQGRMRDQEEQLQFRRRAEWETLFQEAGGRIIDVQARGHFVHRQAFYVLEPTFASTSSG